MKSCSKGELFFIKMKKNNLFNYVNFVLRGRQYFHDNRFGIMNSNMYGLMSLIADLKGQIILDGTGKSSDKKTARKRYISTVMHMFHWYDLELSPGSK